MSKQAEECAKLGLAISNRTLLFLTTLMQQFLTQACRPWVCRVSHVTPRFWQIS